MNGERQENRRSGFTLIEMLVVIAIIAILMGAIVAIGSSVRSNAYRRTTLAELKMLDGLMKDYVAAGNPEPQVPTVWPYSTTGDKTFSQTIPPSDPVNWVIALKSSPEFSKKLDALPNATDANSASLISPTAVHQLILDSYGTHIRYVPYDSTTKKEGYFMSAGPDGQFSNRTPTPSPVLRTDEIYSYDPQ